MIEPGVALPQETDVGFHRVVFPAGRSRNQLGAALIGVVAHQAIHQFPSPPERGPFIGLSASKGILVGPRSEWVIPEPPPCLAPADQCRRNGDRGPHAPTAELHGVALQVHRPRLQSKESMAAISGD